MQWCFRLSGDAFSSGKELSTLHRSNTPIHVFRFFLIKWADRGLVAKGRLNTDLFNVRWHRFLLIF